MTRALETARSRKDIKSSLEAEVAISVMVEEEKEEGGTGGGGGLLYALLDENCRGSPVDFSLADILLVSDVSLRMPSHLEDIGQCVHSDESGIDYRGEASWVRVSAWPIARSAVPKHKCPRCWKYSSSVSGELCSRCRSVCS